MYYARSLRDYIIETDTSKMDTLETTMDGYVNRAVEYMDAYRNTDLSPEEKELLVTFDQAWAEYLPLSKKAMAASSEGNNAEGLRILYVEAVPKFIIADDTMTQISDFNDQRAQQSFENSNSTSYSIPQPDLWHDCHCRSDRSGNSLFHLAVDFVRCPANGQGSRRDFPGRTRTHHHR